VTGLKLRVATRKGYNPPLGVPSLGGCSLTNWRGGWQACA